MEIGFCMNMLGEANDPIGLSRIPDVKAAEYDYVELSLRHIAELSESEFSNLRRQLEKAEIFCRACNNFFPASIRLTGPHPTPIDEILSYVRLVLARAKSIGTDVVVLGSSGAKNLPEGFSREAGSDQLTDLLLAMIPELEKYEIIVAIEPLNRIESNMITTVAEGLELAERVNRPSIGILVDGYHMAVEHEEPPSAKRCAPYLRHLHTADIFRRGMPVSPTPDLSRFSQWVYETGYDGRISIEAYDHEPVGVLSATTTSHTPANTLPGGEPSNSVARLRRGNTTIRSTMTGRTAT
jgi:D-psicose/D-tagatose/L-ribulose 3-epimerase